METSSFLQDTPGTRSSLVGSCGDGMLQEPSPQFQTSQRFVMMENAAVSLSIALVPLGAEYL